MMAHSFAIKWRGHICGDLRIFFVVARGFTCKFHCYLIRLILEEIYKAGEVDPRKLPRNFNSLSAKEQVSTLSTTAKQSGFFVFLFFLRLSRSRLEQPSSRQANQPAFSFKHNDKIKIKQGMSRATGQPVYTGLAHLWTGPKCGIIKYITPLPVSG